MFFFQKQIKYLGHIINKNGLQTDPDRVECIQHTKMPTNVTELKSCLGMVNYYGNFIQNLSTVAGPLHNLLKKMLFLNGIIHAWKHLMK